MLELLQSSFQYHSCLCLGLGMRLVPTTCEVLKNMHARGDVFLADIVYSVYGEAGKALLSLLLQQRLTSRC